MTTETLGILHPGAMGATLGAALVSSGARVLWAAAGRSEATRARAAEVGLTEVASLHDIVGKCSGIVSVCPPSAAFELASQVASRGFGGFFVDANAVAPETARKMEALFASGAADFVDGGIIGPPARRAGTTRLHLSGARASEVARWFDDSVLDARVIEGPVGAASALKMVFAAWTKGTSALLAAIFATARAEGVDAEILEEWQKFVPDVAGRLRTALPASAVKAWRFAGEMREIAATFEDAGIPPGFHLAAAEVYERLAGWKDSEQPPSAEQIADTLRANRGEGSDTSRGDGSDSS